jgi:demethylmenaquinone methyltransferase/2-methoxy-6-polyprenyl-1,4-benzoquinol methylase
LADVTSTPVSEALPAAADKAEAVEAMFDRIAPRYDLLNRMLTMGMDVRWRRAAVRRLELTSDERVLDLACGTGDLCRTLRDAGYAPVGVDFSAGMLRAAHTSVALARADALDLPFPPHSFDGLTCGFALRNFSALPPVFAECVRVLRPGGRVALLDVAEPSSPLPRAVHGWWFRTVVPFVGGMLSDRAAYRYLPASTAYLPSLPELFDQLGAAVFVNLSRSRLGLGAAQLITGTRR